VILDTSWLSDPDSLDAQILHGLHIAGEVQKGARVQESDRGTGRREFALHAATLSATSACVSCRSSAGVTGGELSEEAREGV
jgi:hypothetical protein